MLLLQLNIISSNLILGSNLGYNHVPRDTITWPWIQSRDPGYNHVTRDTIPWLNRILIVQGQSCNCVLYVSVFLWTFKRVFVLYRLSAILKLKLESSQHQFCELPCQVLNCHYLNMLVEVNTNESGWESLCYKHLCCRFRLKTRKPLLVDFCDMSPKYEQVAKVVMSLQTNNLHESGLISCLRTPFWVTVCMTSVKGPKKCKIGRELDVLPARLCDDHFSSQ